MACYGGYNDDHHGCGAASNAYELECIQKWHQPWDDYKPGAVASPFHGLEGVQDNPVYPGQSRVHHAGYGCDHGHNRK